MVDDRCKLRLKTFAGTDVVFRRFFRRPLRLERQKIRLKAKEKASMTTHEEHEENVRKLRELIKGFEVAMLTTIEDDGRLRSRPMAT
jgi:hypothetical protein